MGIETYIIDACVAAKWYLEEIDQEPAIYLADQCEQNKIKLMVPELFFVEMANIFWDKIQRNLLKASQGLEMINNLMNVKLEYRSDHELADVALENALQFNISVYDAMYLSLAEMYVAPLVTADEALVKICKKNRFDFILPLQEIRN